MISLSLPKCKRCKRIISQRVILNARRRGEEAEFHAKRCRVAFNQKTYRDRLNRKPVEIRVVDAKVARMYGKMNAAQLKIHQCVLCGWLRLLHDDKERGHAFCDSAPEGES